MVASNRSDPRRVFNSWKMQVSVPTGLKNTQHQPHTHLQAAVYNLNLYSGCNLISSSLQVNSETATLP